MVSAQNAWAFLVPRIFSEGQLSAILNYPAAKTLETRFCDDENLVINGLKFARAMCSFLFLFVFGRPRFYTAIPWHLCRWNGSKNWQHPKERATTIQAITSGTFTVVRHKHTPVSWMLNGRSLECSMPISSPRFPLIPRRPEKPSKNRLR